MTRQQVAKRLRKSLATVRRLEGVRLHPIQDGRGVHRFDPAEVEALAKDIEQGNVELWQELRATLDDRSHVDECVNCVDLEQRLRAMRDQFEVQRGNHRRELATLQAEHERRIAKHEAEAGALVAQVSELLASLE